MRQVIILLFSILSINAFAAPAKRVLIYTHSGKGFVHQNIAASVECLKKLCTDLGYEAEASDDPKIFTTEKLKGFSCIIFANTNTEAFDSEDQRKALTEFVQKGGACMGIHSATTSEPQWPWFASMMGGKFLRHPALQKFTIRVIDKKHPSTQSLPDAWEWEDECYYSDNLNPDIKILFAADMTTVTDEKKSTYPGSVYGNYFPLAWYHEFDGGRQLYTALGHKPEHYKDELFLKHLKGGLQWLMKDK